MRTQVWWTRAFPLGLLLGLGACAQRPAGPPAFPPLPVQLQVVTLQPVQEVTDYIGRLESRKSVILKPKQEGQVTAIAVQPGQVVKAGVTLVQLEPDRQQAVVTNSQALVAANQANVQTARQTLQALEAQKGSAEAELRLQEGQFKRYERLEQEGAASRELLDQFRTRLLTSQADVRRLNAEIQAQRAAVTQSEKTLQQSQAAVREQQVNLRDLRITAPFTGQVGDIPIKVGDYVTSETEVVTLADNQVLWVNVPVPAERASELRLQMPVQILTPEGQPLGQGRVFFIAPTVNRSDQSVLVKAAYDNTAGRLRADQQVKTQIVWRQQLGVAVPTTAVVTLAGQAFVYVAEPNPEQPGQRVARQRPVRLGPIQANRYPVLEGLQAGDQVITTNLLKLSDGAPVVPETRASQTQP